MGQAQNCGEGAGRLGLGAKSAPGAGQRTECARPCSTRMRQKQGQGRRDSARQLQAMQARQRQELERGETTELTGVVAGLLRRSGKTAQGEARSRGRTGAVAPGTWRGSMKKMVAEADLDEGRWIPARDWPAV